MNLIFNPMDLTILTLQDPWALRAVPAAEGSIDRIRVTNLCLARQLCQVGCGMWDVGCGFGVLP